MPTGLFAPRGFNASKALMFSIAGALQNVHWNELDPGYKQQLLEQLEGQSGIDGKPD